MKFKTHIAVLGLILILLCMIMCGLATMLFIQAGETVVAIVMCLLTIAFLIASAGIFLVLPFLPFIDILKLHF